MDKSWWWNHRASFAQACTATSATLAGLNVISPQAALVASAIFAVIGIWLNAFSDMPAQKAD